MRKKKINTTSLAAKEYVYLARRFNNRVPRARLDATTADLDDIEFVLATSGRRWTR
jgi:sulfite reductase beta subunit-like hemoprotein